MINKKEISVFNLFGAIVMWIITIAWMLFIYKLSSENADESSKRSLLFLDLVSSIIKNEEISEIFVRKAAHVFEFAFLALTSFCAIRFTNNVSPRTSYAESKVKLIKSDNEVYIILSLWLSVFYAILDEYHQLFVSGRSGSIFDVAIDSIGVITMLLIIRIIFSLYLHKIGREEIRYE